MGVDVLKVALVEVEGNIGSVPRSIKRPEEEVAGAAADVDGEPEYLARVLAAANAEGNSEGETSSSAELEDLEGVSSRYCCSTLS